MLLSKKNAHYLILLTALLLQACVSSPSSSSRYKVRNDYGPTAQIDVSDVKDAIPRDEPLSKYGNPKNYEVFGKQYSVRESSTGYREKGISSWYGNKFHGHRTSNGETYDMYAMTAAHKTLPLPSYVRVTHLENGRSVVVKVNDRGPFHQGRIIDLSYSAAKKLGIAGTGTGVVEVVALNPKTYNRKQPYQAKFKKASALAAFPYKPNFKLFLQVGAFINQHNANRLTKRLGRMFKQQQIHSDFLSEKNIYRIRLGPLASVEIADKLSLDLNSKGIPSTRIVVD